jgi:hypothetical protein
MKKFILTLTAAFVLVVGGLSTPPVLAEDPTETVVVAPESSVTLSAELTAVIVGIAMPILVGAITKSHASAFLKQCVGGFCSVVASVIITATQMDGTAILSKEALLTAFGTFIVSQAMYLGVWKPLNLNQKVMPRSGLGERQPLGG